MTSTFTYFDVFCAPDVCNPKFRGQNFLRGKECKNHDLLKGKMRILIGLMKGKIVNFYSSKKKKKKSEL